MESKMFNKSISQMIINFAFIYSSIVCHFKAIEYLNVGETFMAFFLWFCGATSFIAIFRFKIANIVKKLKKNEFKQKK